MSTEPDLPTKMLILHIEVPGIWADDMVPGRDFEPMEIFEESFDTDVILTMLFDGPGEDPRAMLSREARVVGIDTRPLRPSEVRR